MRVLEAFGEPILSGGEESFVINVMQHMNRGNLLIDLLTPYYCDNSYYKSIVESNGGRVFQLGCQFTPGKSRFNIIKSVNSFLRKNSYDAIHIHSGSISVLGIMSYLAKKNGIRNIIVHSHCTAESMTLKRRILRIFFGRIMKNCVTTYCACSKDAGKSKFIDSVVRDKLIIIKNGVDLERFLYDETVRNKMRKQLQINSNEFVLGHVGRFTYEKNHDFLLKCFLKLLEKQENARLILVGDGELREKIEQEVKLLNIKNKVIFTGNVNNVSDYMQAMDCFILPSKFEGLGIVGIEAQAMGLPCVVSDVCPRELKVSDHITFLSLIEDLDVWCEVILKYENYPRKSECNKIKNEGFSIYDTAQVVRNLYLKQ